MFHSAKLASFCAAVISIAMWSGCDSKPVESPELLSQRNAILVTEPLGEAITLEQAAEGWPLEGEVTLTGRVHAEGQDPWDKTAASFLLAILPEAGHDDPEHADNCPFCKRKAANAPKAVVEFQDENGVLLPFGAQPLFDLKRGDVVTVRGTIDSFDLNTFVIHATKLHK